MVQIQVFGENFEFLRVYLSKLQQENLIENNKKLLLLKYTLFRVFSIIMKIVRKIKKFTSLMHQLDLKVYKNSTLSLFE